MQDAIAGFQAAPFWAQIAMVCFAALAVYMLFESTLRKRKFRNHFNGIAREVGAEPRGRDWPFTFSTRSNDWTFTVTHDFRGGKGTSYRGPRGYLLTTSTRLSGSRWPLHQVDVTPVPKLLSRLVSRKAPTGDADFDSRFIVVEDGLPVRDGWLNADTRTAIASFLGEAPLDGRVGSTRASCSTSWPTRGAGSTVRPSGRCCSVRQCSRQCSRAGRRHEQVTRGRWRQPLVTALPARAASAGGTTRRHDETRDCSPLVGR